MASWWLLLLTTAAVCWCRCQGSAEAWFRGHTWRPRAWGYLPSRHTSSEVPRQPYPIPPLLHAQQHLNPRPTPHHPTLGTSSQFLPREVVEALPGVIAKVMEKHGPAPAFAHPSTEPPVIWFPKQEEECPQVSSSGGGFSPFGLLALLVSAANLLSLLATNANNNNNNNNNDNNINNNLLQAGNEVNANNNPNVYTSIVTGVGRRRQRRGGAAGMCWADREELITGEEVVGVVGLAILRSYLQAALARGRGACVARGVCLAHAEAADWGGVATSIAEGLSEAHVEWVTQVSSGASRTKLLKAAERGRLGDSCILLYPCPVGVWAALTQPHALVHALVSLTEPGDERTL